MEPTKIYRAKLRLFRPPDGSFPSPSLPTPRGFRGVPKMAPSCGFRVRGVPPCGRTSLVPSPTRAVSQPLSHLPREYYVLRSRAPLPYQSVFRVSVCIAQTGRSLIHFFILLFFTIIHIIIFCTFLAGRTSTKPLVSLWPRMRHTDDRE